MNRTNLVALIGSQLPEALRQLLQIQVFSDPYMLRTEVHFLSHNGERVASTALRYDTLGGRRCACKIPDEVISFLCLRAPHLLNYNKVNEAIDAHLRELGVSL